MGPFRVSGEAPLFLDLLRVRTCISVLNFTGKNVFDSREACSHLNAGAHVHLDARTYVRACGGVLLVERDAIVEGGLVGGCDIVFLVFCRAKGQFRRMRDTSTVR